MRRTSELPTSEELHRLFSYDPARGKLYWRVGKRWGREAGACQFSHGARFFTHEVTVKGSKLSTARIIWKMATGEDPPGTVIHKNFNRADLRWANLTVRGTAEDVWRNHRPVRTKSGFLGVYRSGSRWMARVRGSDGKLHYLGTFGTMEAAASAVAAYDRKASLVAQ